MNLPEMTQYPKNQQHRLHVQNVAVIHRQSPKLTPLPDFRSQRTQKTRVKT